MTQKTLIKAPFLEQFLDDWATRWIPSGAKKIVDGLEDEELLRYRGEWAVEAPATVLIEGDQGLVLKTLAAHSAISAKFDKPIDPKDKPLVVQYEVNFQNGLECGGAYVKLLTHDPKFDPARFEDKTPYTIMFGPDKCGGNNKVHFIFRHENPKSKVVEEKHLVSPPAAVAEKKTNLYTLVVRPDQSFEILINNETVKTGSLLKDFAPAVNPPKEIDDPKDEKPADWVDEAKIKDPEATKPEDWDEEAPLEIVDQSATQPDDWLVDEPDTIPDPSVQKPEGTRARLTTDWDDEEDGDWTAPSIANPKCADVSGCGKWTAPMIRNPAYKGKWTAPMIDNPDYKGVWAPRKIPNPDYFEDNKPSNFKKMGAIGFELWSMQNGFLFDNIYVGHSEADAKSLAEETWAVKAAQEKLKEPKETAAPDSLVGTAKGLVEKVQHHAMELQGQVLDFITLAKQDLAGAVKQLPHIAGLLVFAALVPLLFITSLFSPSPAASKKAKKEEKQEKVEGEAKATGVDAGKATKRATKKD
ncbi:hypothetical protein HDU91_001440 [Kappamyces sp. JEL0680]|nr:hypothetical protein HDU91_001440 [Kappamyces sp. JEL0680]